MASVHVRVEQMVRYRGDLDDEWESVGEEFHIRVTEAIMEHDAQRLDDADGLLKEIERLNEQLRFGAEAMTYETQYWCAPKSILGVKHAKDAWFYAEPRGAIEIRIQPEHEGARQIVLRIPAAKLRQFVTMLDRERARPKR